MNDESVVLVTGASSGIGKATAEALIRQGHTVYCAARRVDRMDGLKALGGIPVPLDVTKELDLVRMVDRIEEEHGGVDILVNNAGISVYGSMEETTLEDARYQFDVNLFGLGRLTQLVLPAMRRRASPPSVIAETILKALQARRPKTRYAAGKMVRELFIARRLLSDRMIDWLIEKVVV